MGLSHTISERGGNYGRNSQKKIPTPCILRRDHVTSLLRDRHWLPVKQRVEYKLCMMVHRCLYGDAPSYLADLITPSAAATVRPGPGLRSAASSTVAVPPCHELHRRSETGPLRRMAHVHGTNFHHHFVASILLLLSNVNLRHFLYNHAFN